MTAPLGVDRYGGRRATVGDGLLRLLAEATVLAAADVHTARTLARLVDEPREEVVLAAALAVRAVRLGHVYVDLATAAATVTPDDEEVAVELTTLPWPDPGRWVTDVATSVLTAPATDPDADPDRPLRLDGSRLYLDRYWRHERAIVRDLQARVAAEPPEVAATALADGLRRLFPDEQPAADTRDRDDQQRLVSEAAVTRRFTVVAGGPGTGKTTTVARILALLHEQAAALGQPPPRVALAAPTGKAAARLTDAVHAEAAVLDTDAEIRETLAATSASTLHRLLGWRPGSHSRFRHHATNPLPHTVVIVDECSMVGLSMMARLLEAVRPTARLVFVGDPRQLASVEAGAVLGDIVASDLPGTVVLRRVHRFGGAIADVAAAIESGDADAVLDALRASPGEVTWLDLDPEADPSLEADLAGVRAAVVTTAAEVVTRAGAGDATGALEALGAVQVLCAHRRGPAGAARWRVEIERWLRSAIPGYGADAWYAGRPLIVTENDYTLGVFNGDTGVVVDEGGGRLRAVFERRGEPICVRPTRLASVESLYAITIHKAQGSQFGHVVVRLPDPSSRVLTRELLYTAVTRAQRHLTVLGTEEAIRAAVARPVARASGLAEALRR